MDIINTSEGLEISAVAVRRDYLVISAGGNGGPTTAKEDSKNMIIVMKPSTTKDELEAVVAIEEAVGHPDLESDRAALAQIRARRR